MLKYKPVDSDNILLHLISKRNLVENEKTEQFEEMSIVDSNSWKWNEYNAIQSLYVSLPNKLM